jgi:archaellum component FlaG (FlaF/FlaG flagellin family)
MKSRLALFFFAALMLFGAFSFTRPTQAASSANWNPGKIIDDQVFDNGGAMSVAEIQSFLNSKVPVCDTNHPAGPSNQGAQPPWICLKDYTEGGKSAAQIIWDNAQLFSINPRVLLVTLQKENGLVTDTWPYPWQYRTAMGFACPDNGSCNPEYYGFAKQVYQGARHFRNFADGNPSWFIPFRPGTNFVQYNPNSGCGGTNVNIVNGSTAALYSYTPYQPNAAALSNLYGTGDGCSAYGNRNFWRDYTDWFGSTYVPNYQWQVVSTTYSTGSAQMMPGDRQTVTVVAKNTGASNWSNLNNPVRLATSGNRTSLFQADNWISATRPATLQEASVAPNSNGTFVFDVVAPNQPGSYNERFELVAENAAWFNITGFSVPITVNRATYTYSVVSRTDNGNVTVDPGEVKSLTLTVTNTGNTTWRNSGANPVRLATSGNRTSPFQASNWISATRVATLQQATVAPGATGTFVFDMKAPSATGTYDETFEMVAEGLAWFNISTPRFAMTVRSRTYTYSVVSKSVNGQPVTGAIDIDGGQTKSLTLVVKNTGTATWSNTNNPVRLATSGNRTSPFQADSWVNASRAATLQETTVAPNANGTFTFDVKAPGRGGSYNESFDLVAEGLTWFNILNPSYSFNVRELTYTYSIVSQSYDKGSGYVDGASLTTIAGGTARLKLVVKNTGTATWSNTTNPVRLATSGNRTSEFQSGSWISASRPTGLQESSVAPNANGTFIFDITAPNAAQTYNEVFNLVAEGLTWFNIANPTFTIQDLGSFTYSLSSQSYQLSGGQLTSGSSFTLARNATATLTLKITNTGTATWQNSGSFPVRLGTSANRTSPFQPTSGWISATRPAALVEASVAPGGTGTFIFQVKAPGAVGTYTEDFNVVAENATWFNILSPTYTITVN